MKSVLADRSLCIAGAAGAALALAVGYLQWSAHTYPLARSKGFSFWLSSLPIDVLMWAAIGAIVAGAVVYCYRTFTKQI